MDAVEPVVTHPDARVRPRRTITGMSAVLLPHTAGGAVDWDGLAAHVARTAGAGLTPAVNMDTGFVQVLDEATRDRVLEVAAPTLTIGPVTGSTWRATAARSTASSPGAACRSSSRPTG